MTIRYASVCAGIEAASVAWHPLGWTPAWFSEIAPFPCAVLAHHYPTVPNLGDMTGIDDARLAEHGPVDLLIGGTPCQSFSVAGLRKGLADPRGNLALVFLGLLDRLRPRWMVWENVPGVLSVDAGRAFGAFLGGLGQLGYGWSYRVLDAQYFGVAQRRRRVFVVGHAGGWARAAAVLLESSSLRGDPAPSREAGARVAHCVAAGAGGGKFGSGRDGQDDFVVNALDCAATQAVAFQCHGSNVGPMGHLRAGNGNEGGGVPFGVFNWQSGGDGRGLDPRDTAQLQRCQTPATQTATGVRRLTPRECERLQGFPDDFTLVPYRGKPAADGPRYMALGNSMAVPVVRWIGERIARVEEIP